GNQANALAALQAASGLATGFGTQAAGLATAEATARAQATTDADRNLASVRRALDAGLIDKEEATRLTSQILQNLHTPQTSQRRDQDKPIANAMQVAAQLPGSVIERRSSDGDVRVALGSGPSAATVTDAADGQLAGSPVDEALLRSKLVTDPLFTDVTGFLKLLELIEDEKLLDLVEKRFRNLGPEVDAKARFTELETSFETHKAGLDRPDRIRFALLFQKQSILPDSTGLDQQQIKRVRNFAVAKMVERAFTVASKVFNNDKAKNILESIFLTANDREVFDINYVSYILATAYHESSMGKIMTESVHSLVSTDTVFTLDEYFFNRHPPQNPHKASYNGINGNKLAGNQLRQMGVALSDADMTLWNGRVYPGAQPSSVKLLARKCDFYRFIGRGLAQITGRDNYARYSNLAKLGGEDFVANPERVADAGVAVAILVDWLISSEPNMGDFDTAAGFRAHDARIIVNPDVDTMGGLVSDIAIDFKRSLVINKNLDQSSAII
ncbi:MAG: hypothetical protein JSR78_09765, partial [Proteobacteria bacterium]|nr:hypothetical protein [Pseudomonadota bacterium]